MGTGMMTDEEIEGEVIDRTTAVQLQKASELPPNLMLLKMENETIMSAARIAPRDPMKIVEQLKQLIDAYPAAADEAIYSKPVGKVQRVTCGKCGIKYEVQKVGPDTECPSCRSKDRREARQVQKYAEGLSIRAAETIRSVFGYTRMATTCELLPNGDARITGVLVDYAAGNMTSDERIVSPMYKSYSGGMVRTPLDRFLNVVVKAEKSKLRRDVILDSVPGIVKALFRDECEKKLQQLVSAELIEQKVLPAFLEYGITLEHLEEIIGRKFAMGWKEEDRLQLRKILTALKNEETTVEEVLDGIREPRQSGAGGGKAAKDLDELSERLSGKKSADAKEKPAKSDKEAKQGAGGSPESAGQPSGSPSATTAEEMRDQEREGLFPKTR